MKTTAIVALPSSASEDAINHLRDELERNFQNVKLLYEMSDDITHPIARIITANGADLGKIDGSQDAALLANITEIHSTANRIFRAAIQPKCQFDA